LQVKISLNIELETTGGHFISNEEPNNGDSATML